MWPGLGIHFKHRIFRKPNAALLLMGNRCWSPSQGPVGVEIGGLEHPESSVDVSNPAVEAALLDLARVLTIRRTQGNR